jgi:hypothetical protein
MIRRLLAWFRREPRSRGLSEMLEGRLEERR